jgi:hypothetical protein
MVLVVSNKTRTADQHYDIDHSQSTMDIVIGDTHWVELEVLHPLYMLQSEIYSKTTSVPGVSSSVLILPWGNTDRRAS